MHITATKTKNRFGSICIEMRGVLPRSWVITRNSTHQLTIQLLSSALLDQRIHESRIRVEAGVRQCL